ncbi:ATP/GTP-binding protein [Streptomyces sp. NBC_01411]|uniref:GTP-binding protein n=1 Tax=Streptomyces sp. NBC_01411 TaxID=2903857 RepID=UPI0032443239
MAYAPSCDAAPAELGTEPPMELKIIIVGSFGVGKTTLIGTLSEIEPLMTEEYLTAPGAAIDNLDGIADKSRTTVAMDFGRITFDTPRYMILLLFGAPGQERFWFLWEGLGAGAVGAIVLVDTRRLEESFPAVNFYEQQRMPFVVAVNEFDGAYRYEEDEVRLALGLGPRTPVVKCDVRQKRPALDVLRALVAHSLDLRGTKSSGAHA